MSCLTTGNSLLIPVTIFLHFSHLDENIVLYAASISSKISRFPGCGRAVTARKIPVWRSIGGASGRLELLTAVTANVQDPSAPESASAVASDEDVMTRMNSNDDGGGR
jgi:hypothetical protein